MKLARLLLLTAIAPGLFAQSWDTSGNGMLSGTYYFRYTLHLLSNSAGNGVLDDSAALFGTMNFDGAGAYTMTYTIVDMAASSYKEGNTATGTYSIAASGQGFFSNPIKGYSTDSVYGLVNAQHIFVGSSTENANLYHDLFIAAPLSSPQPTVSTFKGAYSMSYLDLSSMDPRYTIGGMLQMNADGAGNLGTVGFAGYQGNSGKGTASFSKVVYIFSGGAAKVTFPSSSTALFSGDYYLYFSPDGNFVFGGSRYASDMLVGVRTGTGSSSQSGLYYEAGLDQDESTFSAGYAAMDSYYGSFNANNGAIVGHHRLLDYFVTTTTSFNSTFSDSYTTPVSGAYTNGATNYVVGNGIRIGSGIGPYLGISVALQAPTLDSSLSSTGVFLNPTGIVNAGSFAPFTADLAPGELLTLFGSGLASSTQIASAAPFPTTLGKVQVYINGIPSPLYYVTPTQLSAIVPYGITGSIAKVQVFNDNVPSNSVTAWISNTAPGVLTQSQNGLGYGDAVHLDGTLANNGNPAQIGETVSVFVTGLGAVSPAIADGAAGPSDTLAKTTGTITAWINGTQATVGYAGLAPQLAGLYQINLTLPAGLTAGDNVLEIDGPDAFTAECLIAVGAPYAVAADRTGSPASSPGSQMAAAHGRTRNRITTPITTPKSR